MLQHWRRTKNATVSKEKSLKWKPNLQEIAKVKEKKRALKAAIKSFETDIEEYSLLLKKKRI